MLSSTHEQVCGRDNCKITKSENSLEGFGHQGRKRENVILEREKHGIYNTYFRVHFNHLNLDGWLG